MAAFAAIVCLLFAQKDPVHVPAGRYRAHARAADCGGYGADELGHNLRVAWDLGPFEGGPV